MQTISLVERFDWIEEALTLRQFVDLYSTRLPQIISVSDGYAGRDEEIHQFSSDEIYWVRQIKRQPRIILEDRLGRYLSVAYSYKGTFQVQDAEGIISSSMSLKEAVARCQSQRCRICFTDDERIYFHKGAECGDAQQMGLLRMHDVYEQKYLIAHSLITDEVLPQAVLIPVYVPIEVIVAQGLTHGTPVNFALFNTSIRQFVAKYKQKEVKLEKDILMFNEIPGNEYEYIFPTTFSNSPESAVSAPSPILTGPDGQAPPRPPRTGSIDGAKEDEVDEENLIELPDDTYYWKMPMGKKLFFPPPPPPDDHDDFDDYEQIFDSVLTYTQLKTDRPTYDLYRMKAAVMTELQKSVQLDEKTIERIDREIRKVIVAQPLPPPPIPKRRATISPMSKPSLPSIRPKSRRPESVDTPKRSEPKISSLFRRCQSDSRSRSWSSAAEIPLNIDNFTVSEVCQCLQLIGLEKHSEKMQKMTVDGWLLKSLDEAILISDFGFKKFEARKLYLFVQNNWRPND